MTEENRSSKLEKIEKLIDATGIRKNYMVLLEQGMNMIANRLLEIEDSSVTIEDIDYFQTRCLEKLEGLKGEVILEFAALYDKYFTEEEIDRLVEHFTSPVGKKMTEIMPVLSKEFLGVGAKYAKRIEEEILKEMLQERMKTGLALMTIFNSSKSN